MSAYSKLWGVMRGRSVFEGCKLTLAKEFTDDKMISGYHLVQGYNVRFAFILNGDDLQITSMRVIPCPYAIHVKLDGYSDSDLEGKPRCYLSEFVNRLW